MSREEDALDERFAAAKRQLAAAKRARDSAADASGLSGLLGDYIYGHSRDAIERWGEEGAASYAHSAAKRIAGIESRLEPYKRAVADAYSDLYELECEWRSTLHANIVAANARRGQPKSEVTP